MDNNSSFDSSDESSYLSDILESESESTLEELQKETEELQRRFSTVVPVIGGVEGKENFFARGLKMSSDDNDDNKMMTEEKSDSQDAKDEDAEEQISMGS